MSAMADLEREQRVAVVAEARTWLRTPYHHAARLKGVGVDCAMFLAEVYAAVGLVPRIEPEPYPPDWHLHRGEERFKAWLNRYAVRVDSPLPGDVAMYRFGRAASHGAIVIAWPRIIHARIGAGVELADVLPQSDLAERNGRLLANEGVGPHEHAVLDREDHQAHLLADLGLSRPAGQHLGLWPGHPHGLRQDADQPQPHLVRRLQGHRPHHDHEQRRRRGRQGRKQRFQQHHVHQLYLPGGHHVGPVRRGGAGLLGRSGGPRAPPP